MSVFFKDKIYQSKQPIATSTLSFYLVGLGAPTAREVGGRSLAVVPKMTATQTLAMRLALLLLLLPALTSASVLSSSIKKARESKGRVANGDAAAPDDATEHGVPEAPLPMMQLRSGLRRQVLEALEAHGASITIMVVGETGAGKTSLLSNLFHRKLEWPVGTRTEGIKELTVSFQLHGEGTEISVPFEARLVDSPGWGDLMSLERSFRLVTRTLVSVGVRVRARPSARVRT